MFVLKLNKSLNCYVNLKILFKSFSKFQQIDEYKCNSYIIKNLFFLNIKPQNKSLNCYVNLKILFKFFSKFQQIDEYKYNSYIIKNLFFLNIKLQNCMSTYTHQFFIIFFNRTFLFLARIRWMFFRVMN